MKELAEDAMAIGDLNIWTSAHGRFRMYRSTEGQIDLSWTPRGHLYGEMRGSDTEYGGTVSTVLRLL